MRGAREHLDHGDSIGQPPARLQPIGPGPGSASPRGGGRSPGVDLLPSTGWRTSSPSGGAEIDRLQRTLDSVREQSENLQAALEGNRRIGMAIGILTATRRLTDAAASECLRQAGNVRDLELRVAAEEVIDQGALD